MRYSMYVTETLSSFFDHDSLFQHCTGASPPETDTDPGAPRRRKRPVVLGKDILEMVHADMAATVYPSFLKRAPPDVGSASAGTLSAEQWRTFCMVNLIITLVRIWGHLPSSDRRAMLLRNFVDLVAAVRAGTAKRVTPRTTNSYGVRMLDYLRGLRMLFLDTSLVPNHHLALHLSEMLDTFGPTHSYWAFPFERCIRLLRNVNTSFHPSKPLILSRNVHTSDHLQALWSAPSPLRFADRITCSWLWEIPLSPAFSIHSSP